LALVFLAICRIRCSTMRKYRIRSNGSCLIPGRRCGSRHASYIQTTRWSPPSAASLYELTGILPDQCHQAFYSCFSMVGVRWGYHASHPAGSLVYDVYPQIRLLVAPLGVRPLQLLQGLIPSSRHDYQMHLHDAPGTRMQCFTHSSRNLHWGHQ
jgi:hypothetical protein